MRIPIHFYKFYDAFSFDSKSVAKLQKKLQTSHSNLQTILYLCALKISYHDNLFQNPSEHSHRCRKR